MSETYRIRPLVSWSRQLGSDVVETPFGRLEVFLDSSRERFAIMYGENSLIKTGIATSAAAKAAAEQWYREKLLTALERVT